MEMLKAEQAYLERLFLIPLILDEFQSEEDTYRDMVLAKQAMEKGIIDSWENDLRYTVLVTSMFDETGKNVTLECEAEVVDQVAGEYFQSFTFCTDDKMITLLWAKKTTFEQHLQIITEKLCERAKCVLGKECLIGVGNIQSGLSCLHRAYVDAIKAGNYMKKKATGVCFISDINQHKNTATLITEQALALIERNYMDAELSLVSISSQIAVSPNYLSSSFKKITGSTFIDLLSQKRIRVAKELLLNSNRKVREVAEECGYRDQHYFSYCFKKYTGMSPNECRRKAGEAEEE